MMVALAMPPPSHIACRPAPPAGRPQDLRAMPIAINDPPQALCQLCLGYELAFAGLRFNSGANDGHERCVQWTHQDPFSQFVDGTFAALSDTLNTFNQFKRLK
jgi:hypothetical protein